jgi:hypothetical protein
MCHSWVANGGHLGISHHHCSASLHTGHALLAHSITSHPAGADVVGRLVTAQPYAADDQPHCCQLASPLPRTTHARRHAQACQQAKDVAGALPHAPPATHSRLPVSHTAAPAAKLLLRHTPWDMSHLEPCMQPCLSRYAQQQASGVYVGAHSRSLLHHRPAPRNCAPGAGPTAGIPQAQGSLRNQAMRVRTKTSAR